MLIIEHLLLARLVTLGKSSAEKISPQDTRALPILILIVALLCEHCNFEQLRTDASPVTDDTLPEIRADLAMLTQVRTPHSCLGGRGSSVIQDPINEYIYALFLRLYDRFSGGTLRGRILLCLGKSVAYPALSRDSLV